MSLEKVFFGFFVLFAATLNFGFFVGGMSDPAQHSSIELYAALIVNVFALVIKLGDRTQLGAVHLATSLVAVLQLTVSAVLYALNSLGGQTLSAHTTATIVSFSGGALFANVVSVVLLVIETASFRRR
jgi:putative Ca2+/H+ antiporter (TMEM165/GDT1 family)